MNDFYNQAYKTLDTLQLNGL